MSRVTNQFPAVNKSEETATLPTGSLFAPSVAPIKSPIDEYYASTKSILIRTGLPHVQSDSLLMRLFLIETIASVELYLRRILANLINLCPIVREKISVRPIPFRAARYYQQASLGFALLEHVSLSDSEAVVKLTKEITDFDIKPSQSVGVALADYDKICNLRHSVAHACGEIGANNIAWHKPVPLTPVCVRINVLELQSIIAIAHNIVRAYNRFLFETIFLRWRKQTLVTNNWAVDRVLFEPLAKLFYSADDMGPLSSEDLYHRCLAVSNTSA